MANRYISTALGDLVEWISNLKNLQISLEELSVDLPYVKGAHDLSHQPIDDAIEAVKEAISKVSLVGALITEVNWNE